MQTVLSNSPTQLDVATDMDSKHEFHRTASQSTVSYSPLPEPNGDRLPSMQHQQQEQQQWQQQANYCCIRDRRNQPQANALGAAALIFLSGGLNIAWSIGFDGLADELIMSSHLRISWFVAAIIGALLGVLVSKRISYKLLMQLSSLLVLFGGLLFIGSKPEVQRLIIARYLNGLANGLVLPATLAMAGELAVFYKRGTIASATEQMACTVGIYTQILLCVNWSPDYDMTVDQMQGALCATYGGIGLLVASIFSIESPVRHLARDEQDRAIEAITRLQHPRLVTSETYNQLTEHSCYLAHNRALKLGQAWWQALPALLRLCLLRALYAMSTSMQVMFTLTLASSSVYGQSPGPYVLFGLLRLMGSCSGAYVQDKLGRKLTQLIGFMICGGASLGLASRFTTTEFVRLADLRIALWLLLLFQFFAGLSFSPSSVYLAEAFPLSIKRICIAIVYVLELTVQLAICSVDLSTHTDSAYFYGLGIFMTLGFLLGHWYLPETKFMTLRQAQLKFRDFS